MNTADQLLELAEKIEAANREDLAESHQDAQAELSDILAYVRALSWSYLAAHWQARGSTYYGDHLLFERLYKETDAQVDGIAEKVIGLTESENSVDPVKQIESVAKYVSGIAKTGDDVIARMLAAEQHFVKKFMPDMIGRLEKGGHLTDGLENSLQGIMDAHEGFIYLLQRRCKG
jgi:DNA-binding ferritin-like protein